VLQQRRLPPALGRAAVALLLVQSLPLLKKTIRETLRHEEITPRHNAFRVMQQATDAASASNAYQPEHRHLAECSSGKQIAALLQANVDVVHMPQLRVSSRRKATSQHELPALHAASRRQAKHGMRHELSNELAVWARHERERESRVRFQPGDERVPRMLLVPALVFTECSVRLTGGCYGHIGEPKGRGCGGDLDDWWQAKDLLGRIGTRRGAAGLKVDGRGENALPPTPVLSDRA
jgi:hypothetical protein